MQIATDYILRQEKNMFYWILLGLAIVSEIIGTLSMKWASVSGGHAGMILMLTMIAFLIYFFHSLLRKLRSAWLMRCGKGSVFC